MAFAQGLQELGWTVGRNVRIDTRWTGLGWKALESCPLSGSSDHCWILAGDGCDANDPERSLAGPNAAQQSPAVAEACYPFCRKRGRC